jgi:hypothetical protein
VVNRGCGQTPPNAESQFVYMAVAEGNHVVQFTPHNNT